jgi:hypothetical protein
MGQNELILGRNEINKTQSIVDLMFSDKLCGRLSMARQTELAGDGHPQGIE